MSPLMQNNAAAEHRFTTALAKVQPPANTRYEARTAASRADVQVIHHNGRTDR